jgi:hypothetical protein
MKTPPTNSEIDDFARRSARRVLALLDRNPRWARAVETAARAQVERMYAAQRAARAS